MHMIAARMLTLRRITCNPDNPLDMLDHPHNTVALPDPG